MDLHEYLDDFTARDWQTTDDGTVRMALVGLGWWTIDHAIPAIEETDHCETTVLVTGSPEKGERVAADVESVTRVLSYDEYHDGAGEDAYDAVYICTPNAFHLDYARSAARLGKHVLCEKPMEATAERAATMVEVCDEHGVALVVGYRMQTEPVIRRARELISEGAIGEPKYVHGSNTQRLLDIIPDTDQWRLNADLSGYGTSVMDLGIYPINTTRFLLDADPIAAQAAMRSDHDAFDDVPDEHAAFLLEFENGVYASCSASQNAHGRTFLELTGTDGHVRIDPAFHGETEFSLTVDGDTVAFDTDEVDQMTEIFDYFGHAVLTDASVVPDGEHGLVDMRALEAIHAAADSDERVTVDDG